MFKEKGYCIFDNFVNLSDIKKLQNVYQKVIDTIYKNSSTLLYSKCPSLLWIKNPENVIGNDITLNKIIKRSKLFSAELFDVPAVNIQTYLRFFHKPVGSIETPWHQDKAYLKNNSKERINIWIPLDNTEKQNGCLNFIPYSHKQKLYPHELDKRNLKNTTLYIKNINDKNIVTISLLIGQASAHHWLTIHSANSNISQNDRRSLVIICEKLS